MAGSKRHYYWDACVFVAFLNSMQEVYGRYVDHIGQFLEESREGGCVIYTSTITIAEIPAKRIAASEYGGFQEFLEDFEGAVVQIGADPNIMAIAASLRDITYTKTGGKRDIATPDAIHLASALALFDDYGVPLSAFHTFDDGKSRGPDGKSLPLLSFEEWCEGCRSDPIIGRVLALVRTKPEHPDPKLPLILPIAAKASDDAVVPIPPRSLSVVTKETANRAVSGEPEPAADARLDGTEKPGDAPPEAPAQPRIPSST